MSAQEGYIPIEQVAPECNTDPSAVIPKGAKIRVKDYLLEEVSTNDKKKTVTFRIAGVFLPAPKIIIDLKQN